MRALVYACVRVCVRVCVCGGYRHDEGLNVGCLPHKADKLYANGAVILELLLALAEVHCSHTGRQTDRHTHTQIDRQMIDET